MSKPLIPWKAFRLDDKVCPRCGEDRRYVFDQSNLTSTTYCGEVRTRCVAPREIPDIQVGDYVFVDGYRGKMNRVKGVGPHGVALEGSVYVYVDYDQVELGLRKKEE